jgi:ubiquinone/menaquinone biosynthesis C-methylase UbiE
MNLKRYLGHLVFKTIGTVSFVRRIEWPNILQWLELKAGDKVLDVACGGGALSVKVAQKGCSVYGIDYSESSINTAKQLAQRENTIVQFEVSDAAALPYPDEYFDKLVCSSSLEHFPNDRVSLHEMKRVLKPAGILVLTTDSTKYLNAGKLGEKHRINAHVVNYYTLQILSERLEFSGFEIIKSKYLLRSPITSLFNRVNIRLAWQGNLWLVVNLIAYPLCLLAEILSIDKQNGYTIIVKATKTAK